MRVGGWIGCVIAVGVTGCSYYPIPDDVSAFETEKIVRYARCEMREAIREFFFEKGHIPPKSSGEEIKSLIKKKKKEMEDREKSKKKKPLTDSEAEQIRKDEQLVRLASVASAYTFDFNITEHSLAGGGVGFSMPWLANSVDAKATAALDLTRQGSRVFGAEDNWEDLISDERICRQHQIRSGNIAYPLSGSIGAGALVRTFIDIEEQGGAKDNFVDTLTFTTLVSGGAEATLKLEPVSNQFRVVSANAGVNASRLDIHKLTISLAFPADDPSPITGVIRTDGDLNAPFERPAPWRARYNLCVQDARSRENAFKQLRYTAPEIYCISYADEFAPKYQYRLVRQARLQRTPINRSPAALAVGTPDRGVRGTFTRPVRENLRPFFQ